ncbi:hypothetical protein FRX31_009389, partial [Thalictrum thalictroides]
MPLKHGIYFTGVIQKLGCFDQDFGNERTHQQRQVLVAASVGSYGAYLADVSEY